MYTQNAICGLPDIKINNENISRPKLCDENQLYIRNPVNEYSFECIDVVSVEQFNTSNTNYFVEKNEYDNNRVTLEALASLSLSFNHSTPLADNLSHTSGIKNAEESIFGYPPNKDNSGIVNILILDIRDNFNGSGNYIAGYFDQNDQSDNYFSNKKDIVYIDCNPVDMISSNPVEAIYTLAHEYEHLLHYNSDQYEAINNPWLDEGLADLAPSILGLGHRNYGYYLGNTSIGLDDWVSNELPYYSKSALFLQYVYEHEDLGLDFIKSVFTDADYQRLESIKHNYYDFVFDKNFNTFFDDWIINTILDNYPLSECLNELTPQNNITLDLQEELLLTTLNIPAYSSYHTFIPDNVNKDQIIELTQNETSVLINLTNNTLIENYDNGIWEFSNNNYNYTFTYSFFNHEIPNQFSEYIIMINSFENFHEINYDNDEILAYVDIGNKERWFSGIKYFIENKSLITSIDFKVLNDTPITINIIKGGIDYTPQYSIDICSPTGSGWNNINLTQADIFVENEYLYVVMEFNDNAVGYSEYLNDINNSYYSLNGNIFSNINNVIFPSSGDNLHGNWAIRATYIDSNYISIIDTLNIPYLYPNPFFPKSNSNISTYILSQTNKNYSIDIYNIQGKHIINLYNDRPPIDRFLNLTWDGVDKSGLKSSSGLYMLVHNTGEIVESEKFLLIY